MTNAHEYTDKWNTIRNIVKEEPKIIELVKLKEKGLQFIFTPDFSEIQGYIAPHRDISKETFERDIRRWYAVKALLESPENSNILLSPYFAELSKFIERIRHREEKSKILFEPLQTILESNDFLDALERLSNDTINRNIKSSEEVLAVLGQYGKEMGLLLELMMHNDEIKLLKNLWQSGKLNHANKVLDYIDENLVLKQSIEYQLEIKKMREKKYAFKDSTSVIIRSHFDGWAVEYVRYANEIASKKLGQHPFIIFVSRSTDIEKAVGSKLSISINGETLHTLWTPETYLTYHLLSLYPGKSYQEILKAHEDLYNLVDNHKKSSPNQEILNRVLETNNLAKSIENLSLFHLKASDDFFKLDDIKKFQNTPLNEVSKASKKLFEFLTKQDLVSLLQNMEQEINILWTKFRENTPIIGSGYINTTPHIVFKLPGNHLWIQFKSKEIFQWLSNTDNIYEAIEEFEKQDDELYKILTLKDELSLFKALIKLFTKDWKQLDQTLEKLKTVDNIDINREVFLLNISQQIIRRHTLPKLDLLISKFTKTFGGNDPRIYKILSLASWQQWEKTSNHEHLKSGWLFAEQAINLSEGVSEFTVECLNNFIFLKILQHETADEKISIYEIQELLDKFEANCSQVFENNPYPIEIHHTLGKLYFHVALNAGNLDASYQSEMINNAISHFSIALRSDTSNKYFIEDYGKAIIAQKNFEIHK